MKSENIEVTICVTGPGNDEHTEGLIDRVSPYTQYCGSSISLKKTLEDSYEEGSIQAIKERIEIQLNHSQFVEGRPDWSAVVRQEIDEAENSISIVGCRHPARIDNIRAEAIKALDQDKRIDFYNQLMA